MNTPNWRYVASTWLRAVAYVKPATNVGPGLGMVLMQTKAGKVYCWLAPSWVYGLVCAHRSTGRSITMLVKRYAVQRAVRVPALEGS